MCVANDARLAEAELEGFKEQGYVVKRSILDRALCAQAVDQLWACLPPRIKRQRPWTWWGTVTDSLGTKSLWRRRGILKFRDEVQGESQWLALLPFNRTVLAIAEQLLGREELDVPERIRGLYPTFPRVSIRRRSLRGHIDGGAYQLGVLGYLEQVKRRCGGFTVWPGSHRVLVFDFAGHLGPAKQPSYAEHKAQIERREPVEITGQAGDVVFYHHRLLHTAGRNERVAVRQAVLAEFVRKDALRNRAEPPPPDMWQYWWLDGRRSTSSGSRPPLGSPPAWRC